MNLNTKLIFLFKYLFRNNLTFQLTKQSLSKSAMILQNTYLNKKKREILLINKIAD